MMTKNTHGSRDLQRGVLQRQRARRAEAQGLAALIKRRPRLLQEDDALEGGARERQHVQLELQLRFGR